MFNGQKNNHPLLRRKRRQPLTCRVRTVKGRFLRKKIRILCKFRAKCKIPSRSYWHPPVCHNHTSQSGCKYGEKCQFRRNDAEETPSKKSKKGSAKGSVALLKKKSKLCLCISRFLSEEVYSTESWKNGIERVSRTHRKILRRHLALNQNSGKKRATSRNYPKV